MLNNKLSTDLHNKIYKEVVENLEKKGISLTSETVEKVSKSQWEFLTYVMRLGENESLRLQFLGNMGVKTYREAFSSKRYLTTEEFQEFIKLPRHSDEALAFLQNKYDVYKEKYRHLAHINRDVIVYKKDKEIARCKLHEASELTNIPPIHVFISCCKGTKTRNNYKFEFDGSEETFQEQEHNDKGE